jgi:hypothetical protein
MKLLSIIVFCIFSLVATLALAYGLYPHAKLSESQLKNITTPQSMESFEQVINLGDDFGEMSVIDLMGNYLDNPPAPNGSSETSKPKRQFGGC